MKYCPECGSKLEQGWNYCVNCGHRVDTTPLNWIGYRCYPGITLEPVYPNNPYQNPWGGESGSLMTGGSQPVSRSVVFSASKASNSESGL